MMQNSSPARHDVLWSAKGPRSPLSGLPSHVQHMEHPPPRRSVSRSTLGDDRTLWGESFSISIVDPQVCVVAIKEILLRQSNFESIDTSSILRLPCNWRSELGPACWTLCVCTQFFV